MSQFHKIKNSIGILKKFDSRRNNYISDLDLINKYRVLEKKEIPCLEKILMEFSVPSTSSNEDHNKIQFDSEFQIKCSFIFYLLIVEFPFLLSKNWKVLRKDNYSQTLKISLSNRHNINLFLSSIFFDKESLLSFSVKSLKKKFLNVKNTSDQRYGIVVESNFNLDTFAHKNLIFSTTKVNDLNFKIKFFFSIQDQKKIFDKKTENIFNSFFFSNFIRN